MRKRLPMTALITGLLAAPALGGAALPPGAITDSAGSAAPFVETFPSEMPAEVTLRARRWARGEKLNAFGMQALQTRITRAVSAHLDQAIAAAARETLVPVEYDVVAAAPAPTMAPVAAEKSVTFLGVRLEPTPNVLADQLQLPHGMGLLVDEVTAESPAEKGGLKVNDLLQKLDDQVLVNEEQIQALIHARKPGDSVTFTMLRGGQSAQATVTLGEKAAPTVPMVPEGARHTTRTFSSSSMTTHADGSLTRTLIDDEGTIVMTREKTGKATVSVKDAQGKELYNGAAEGASAALPAELAKKVADVVAQRDEVRIELTPPQNSDAGGRGSSRIVTLDRDDGTHEIELRDDGAGTHLRVKEIATGKVLYDGVLGNPDDLLAQGVPQKVVEKVKMALAKLK